MKKSMKHIPVWNRFYIFLTLLGTLFVQTVFAQTSFDDYRQGSAINACVLNVVDPTRITAPPAGHVYTNDNPVVDVLFELKDDKQNLFPNNWSITIIYNIDLYTTATSFTTKTAEFLTINYDKNKPYKDISIKSYPGYKKAQLRAQFITLTTYSSTGTPTSTNSIPANTPLLNWEDIILTLRYVPDYVYSWTTTANTNKLPKHKGSPINTFCALDANLDGKNEMLISWGPQMEAQSYELEWVFVDIPSANFDDDVTIDWRNAVRINIPTPSYSIPLTYPRGKIVYRYRTISKETNSDNLKFRQEGIWSQSNWQYIQTITSSNKYYFNYCGLEPGKNWSYASSYAEEGKRAEQLTFVDAMGRDRRTITHNYQEGKAIISKTYYDKQGRAAIQALPVPVTEKGNVFYDDFNDDFDHSGFDTPAALNNSPGMSTTQPASVYYSSSNPFLAGNPQSLAYTPDAEKYPFVQTKFKSDGSGRPGAISQPGPNNRIGSGHETLFSYGTVDGQQLLDRLFGNEVGFSEHYKRNMTSDPNGVTSISYVDGSGRVVATALAGSTSMQNLNNVPHNTGNISINLLDNMSIGADGSVTNLKEIIVPVSALYTFTYSLQGASYTLGCLGERACKYDLTCSITNEAGFPVSITYNGNSIPALTLTNINDRNPAINFTATLPPGKYTIKKTISLNSSTESYVSELETLVRNAGPGPNNPCIPQDLPAGNGCYTCDEKCEQVYQYQMTYEGITGTVWIGTGNTLYTKTPGLAGLFPGELILDPNGTYTDPIDQLIKQCQIRCENSVPQVNISECDIMRQVMMMDVSPGGQYFDNHPATLGIPGATQSIKDRWLNMFIPVTVKNGLFSTAGVTSWEALRGVWADSMASTLLPYHPEYCQYNYFCNLSDAKTDTCCKKEGETNLYTSSADFNAASHVQHTDAFGHDNGFFDPLSLANYYPLPPAYMNFDCKVNDPYFCNNPTAYDAMSVYLRHYIPNPWLPGKYFSIWDVLEDDGSTYTASTPEEASLIAFLAQIHQQFDNQTITKYQFFRGYYQGRKRQIIQNGFPAWAATNCGTCTNFTAGACATCVDANNLHTPPDPEACRECWLSAFDAHHDGVIDAGYTAPACFNATTNRGDLSLKDFNIRYPYISALNAENSSPEDICTVNCSGYANSWISQLGDAWLGCELSNGITQAMRDYLYDEFYAYCMGSCTALPVLEGTLPDFNSPTAQNDLNTIISGFKSQFNVNICPPVSTPTGGNNKLPCQCSNLGEMIRAADASNPSFPNPFHYALYGQPLGSVVHLPAAAAYLSNFLTEANDSPVTITPSQLEEWINVCANRTSDTIPGIPAELSCSVTGGGAISCENLNNPIIEMMVQARFEKALEKLLADYRTHLLAGCLNGLHQRETFTVSYSLDEFQYTLYYYDRAGNLIKTVPPAGVQVLNNTEILAAGNYREANYISPLYATGAGFKRPDHRLVTNYKYNSLEQLVEQTTPDAGTTKFWYDAYGRLVISQNARQIGANKYSYTRYDAFGRIYETGEVTYANGFTQTNTSDNTWLGTFYTNTASTRRQVTYTRYDAAHTGINLPTQENLRNRVASSYYFEEQPMPALTNYIHATHYSYDNHGNVTKSIQDFPFLNQFGMRFSETEYEYNLIDGNVKKVSYRKGLGDQFYHRYQYDADQRLITVQTSRDGKIWETDAKYFYQAHGPLYRVETGDKKIQGTDYAQTIHGWHKGVNGQRLDPNVDMGKDGRHVLAIGDGGHHLFARDAFGYTLSYFNGDYKRIATAAQAFEADIFAGPMGASIMGLNTAQNPRGQYNGNIAAMVTALRNPSEAPLEELGQVFQYDQLYRLVSSRSFVRTNAAAFTWAGINQTNNRWATNYTYDANGNIKTLQRYNEATTAVLMDNMTYGYDETAGRLNSNRLYNVNDLAGSSTVVEDYRINNTSFNLTTPIATGHFKYDEIGNLKQDIGETGELNIEWNLYGKVKKATRTSGTKTDLEFYYDAAGRRIMKIAKPHNTAGTRSTWKYTIFTYDAGGQLMAEYDLQYYSATNSYIINNNGHYLYGASKLGRTRRRIPGKNGVAGNYSTVEGCASCATASIVASPFATAIDTTSRSLGLKQYEFGNHLGNVLVTLSDRRLPVDDGLYLYGGTTLTKTSNTPDGKLDYYLPDVLTTNDYYPGGMPMPGRSLDGTTCTTTSTPTTATVHSVTFASGLAGYTAMPGGVAAAYVTGGSPAQLSVNKSSAAAGNWGVRSPWITMTQGVTYSLSYVMGYGGTGCGFFSIPGWRIVNSAGTVVAGGGSLTSPVSGSFTPAATGSYAIEFYRVDGSAGCFFTVGDVQLTTTTYTHTTNCTANSADAYPWGHNGQLKDNEIYGQGNAYSAEYWEYDARLLRRWNTDPITYADQSTYACFNNNPVYYSDPLGLAGTNANGGGGKDKKHKVKDPVEAANRKKKILDFFGIESKVVEWKDENGNAKASLDYHDRKGNPVSTVFGRDTKTEEVTNTPNTLSGMMVYPHYALKFLVFTERLLEGRGGISILSRNGSGTTASERTHGQPSHYFYLDDIAGLGAFNKARNLNLPKDADWQTIQYIMDHYVTFGDGIDKIWNLAGGIKQLREENKIKAKFKVVKEDSIIIVRDGYKPDSIKTKANKEKDQEDGEVYDMRGYLLKSSSK
jgi:YD repeat-containing protein